MFEVSFNSPQCGWMSIGFEDGNSEFHTTTAHAPHGTALPELLRILTAIADEHGSNQTYLLKWNRDPEEFDFEFERSDETVAMRIYEYPTETRDDGDRELVYSHSAPGIEVCKAFAATFKQLYEDRDTDEFEFNWRQPFPMKEFGDFMSRINPLPS